MPKKQTAVKKTDASLHIIVTFLIVIFSLTGLMLANRYVNRAGTMFTLFTVMQILSVSGIVLFIGSAVMYFQGRRREKDNFCLIGAVGMVVFACLAFFCGFISLYGGLAIKLLYIIFPAGAVLYLLSLIYQRDFFAIALISSSGGFAMWILTKLYNMYDFNSYGYTSNDLFNLKLGFSIICLAILAIAAVLIFLMQKNKGILKIGRFKIKFFTPRANYPLVYIACALTAAAFFAAFFLGSAIAFYAMFVLFGYLFICAVYYTVKLM